MRKSQLIHGDTVKNGKIYVFLSFLIVYISLVGSVTIANGQIEWSQSTNFNRIQDGAWLKVQMKYFLLLNLKEQEKLGRSPFTVS